MKTHIIYTFILVLATSSMGFAQCGSSNNHHSQQTSYSHHTKDIVGVATSSDQFETLVVALKAADFLETLHSDGPFTVFAPVNSAFAKLPDGTVSTLLDPANKDQLTKILTYHVVAGKFNAKDVIAAVKAAGGEFKIKTVSGDILVASIQNGTLLLTAENGGVSAVTQADVAANNGGILVIDSVVLPS
ncbi:MAG: fasciclin domain-containing protein [Flavobacteriales bacterium]|nr:fasciclin domain-containing protein [Flavobacteriales bacterium]